MMAVPGRSGIELEYHAASDQTTAPSLVIPYVRGYADSRCFRPSAPSAVISRYELSYPGVVCPWSVIERPELFRLSRHRCSYRDKSTAKTD